MEQRQYKHPIKSSQDNATRSYVTKIIGKPFSSTRPSIMKIPEQKVTIPTTTTVINIQQKAKVISDQEFFDELIKNG